MEKLHCNRKDFADLITIASNQSGISADILEKDYYVCLLLQELSNMKKVPVLLEQF